MEVTPTQGLYDIHVEQRLGQAGVDPCRRLANFRLVIGGELGSTCVVTSVRRAQVLETLVKHSGKPTKANNNLALAA